jgi:hypothetical protein
MTEGRQLVVDFISGGFALLILRSVDRWIHRAKGNQTQKALRLNSESGDHSQHLEWQISGNATVTQQPINEYKRV